MENQYVDREEYMDLFQFKNREKATIFLNFLFISLLLTALFCYAQQVIMILYQFELALTPPSILFSLRTLGNFPAFLRMCMMPIYLVPSYQCFCVFTLLSPKFMKLKLTKALNIIPPLLHSNSMNNHAQKSKGLLQAGQIYIGLSTSCSRFSKTLISRNFSKSCFL